MGCVVVSLTTRKVHAERICDRGHVQAAAFYLGLLFEIDLNLLWMIVNRNCKAALLPNHPEKMSDLEYYDDPQVNYS